MSAGSGASSFSTASATRRTWGRPRSRRFLTYLATQRGVSASTQNQALCALLFLYKQVLGVELGWVDGVTRAKKPERVPVVLTRQEVGQSCTRCAGATG